MNEENKKTVKGIIARFAKVPPKKINRDTHLVDDLGLDSLVAAIILAKIEKEFELEIAESDAFSVIYMRDIYKLMDKYL